jgi:DNA-binding GntR family transcriptional regulator
MTRARPLAVEPPAVTAAPPRKSPRRTTLPTDGTLSHTIYAAMLERLQKGRIGPHDRVLDHELAQQFQCTRMPARQALLRLVSDGYLVGTTRGFVIPTLADSDIREIFELRRMLEPDAAAGTVDLLAASQLALLRRSHASAVRAHRRNDMALMIEANMQFRGVWLGAVRNSRLRDTIQRFTDHAQQVRLGTLGDEPTQAIVVTDQKALVEGFTARDARQVRLAMLAFIDDAERQYFALQGAAHRPA